MGVDAHIRDALAADELGGGKSIANVRIHTHTSILDGIITLGTFGVLSPRSVSYEGVIV